MRITDNMVERNVLFDLGYAESRLLRLQNMASSGKRISRPEDDPVGTQRSMSLRTHMAHNDQFMRNLSRARGWMEQTEQSLSELSSVLVRARELGIYGATDTISPQAREALAAEISQLADEVLTIGNVEIEGRKLLTGTRPEWKLGPGVIVTVENHGSVAQGGTGLLDEIYSALRSLEAALVTGGTGDTSQILASTQALDVSLDRVLSYRVINGARLRRLDIMDSRGTETRIEYTKLLSDVEDVDLSYVLVDLQAKEAAYRATLGVAARIIQPTLLDFLK